MNYLKNIVATIPLVMGLTGTSMAAIAESGDAGSLGGEPVSIESLLNRYTGLVPGDQASDSDHQELPPSERLAAFTRAIAPMSSGYTVMGSDRPVFSNRNGDGQGVTSSDAAAPAVAAITVAHFVQDSLVSAVSSGITPTSSSGSSPSAFIPTNTPGDHDLTTTITPTNTLTTTITPNNTLTTTITPINIPASPVPIPPAFLLLGSGLAFLAPLRNRLRPKII